MSTQVARFTTGYMDEALEDLSGVVARAIEDLSGVDFDTIVGTGFSGGVVIPALAMAMGKRFVLIRKETDDSHHGGGRLIGSVGERWIFLDDFMSSGRTRRRVHEKLAHGIENQLYHRNWEAATTYVGMYLYAAWDAASERYGVFYDTEQSPAPEPERSAFIAEPEAEVTPLDVQVSGYNLPAATEWSDLGYTTVEPEEPTVPNFNMVAMQARINRTYAEMALAAKGGSLPTIRKTI